MVLGVCLTTEIELGLVDAYQKAHTLLRVQLINRGILNLDRIHFHDRRTQKSVDIPLNFLHSYEQ